MMRFRHAVLALSLAASAASVEAQSLPLLTRATAGEVDDSTLLLVSLASPFRTRAVTLGILKTKMGGGAITAADVGSGTFPSGTYAFTGATALTGGAGNMTIQSGTGNSRTMTLQTTSSTGVVKNTLVLGADSSLTTIGNLTVGLGASVKLRGTAGTTGSIILTAGGADTSFLILNQNFQSAAIFYAQRGTLKMGDSLRLGSTIGTGAAVIAGGAGNMTIQAGTGNSRTMTLQTTTSAGTAKNTLVLGADSSATFLGKILAVDSILVNNGGTRRGGLDWNGSLLELQAPNSMRIKAGGGNVAVLDMGASNIGVQMNNAGQFKVAVQSGTRTATLPGLTFSIDTLAGIYNKGTAGANDTIGITVNGVNQAKFSSAGVLLLPNLPSEGSTKNAVCWDGTTFNVTQNAAATCTVSARRFKENIKDLPLSDALTIVMKSRAVSYDEKATHQPHIGVVAEEADSVDHRLATRDSKGQITSVNYEQYTIALLRTVQEQQRQIIAQQQQIDELRALILQSRKP